MGMSYQVEELVVPALAHVVGSGITVDCGIMYVPKMPYVTHQLSVLNRDMFSSMSVYRTYAKTSLLARRPLTSGSGITVDCGIMYVPNGWWKHRWAAS
jgi:hypothetical protein